MAVGPSRLVSVADSTARSHDQVGSPNRRAPRPPHGHCSPGSEAVWSDVRYLARWHELLAAVCCAAGRARIGARRTATDTKSRQHRESGVCPEVEIASSEREAKLGPREADCDPPTDHNLCAMSANTRMRQRVTRAVGDDEQSKTRQGAHSQWTILCLTSGPLHTRFLMLFALAYLCLHLTLTRNMQ